MIVIPPPQSCSRQEESAGASACRVCPILKSVSGSPTQKPPSPHTPIITRSVGSQTALPAGYIATWNNILDFFFNKKRINMEREMLVTCHSV